MLLFGEYAILLGSSALSIPYGHFNASLNFIRDDIYTDLDLAWESNRSLRELCDSYLVRKDFFNTILDLEQFSDEILKGLYLESNIPKSYGLGSSGALCAAVYARYARNRIYSAVRMGKDELLNLRRIFQEMESVFHSRSSGFDPLVIYMRFPLHIDATGNLEIIRLPRIREYTSGGIFLIDSGPTAKTGPLVKAFLDKYAPGGIIDKSGEQLCQLTNNCINDLLKGQISVFFNHLKELSQFQLDGLDPMIPESIRSTWKEGLYSDLFYLKLCGSGGGGFVTGFTKDYHRTAAYFKENGKTIVPVYLAAGLR